METYTLSVKQLGGFTDDEFYFFCKENNQLKFERDATGQIIIMPNTGGKTGDLNSEINMQLRIWNKQQRLGRVFDSSTAFRLPSSAVRSPDAAWVRADRWAALSEDEKTKFPPLCPDFVIELRSETDMLRDVQKKITEEWLDNGCQLAWLIDPKEQKVYVYEANQEPTVIEGFDIILRASAVMSGFELDLKELL